MRGSFHIFLEHLINLTYQHQREKLSKSGLYGKIQAFVSSYIHFGGWDINYNGRGWTRLFIEKVGNIEFVSKTIYLNVNFTYRLSGLATYPAFDFPNLINTISYELSHCLLGDFDLKWAKLHDERHEILTQEIENYLWTLPEIKELERLAKKITKRT